MKRFLTLVATIVVVVIGATNLLYSATDKNGNLIESDFEKFFKEQVARPLPFNNIWACDIIEISSGNSEDERRSGRWTGEEYYGGTDKCDYIRTYIEFANDIIRKSAKKLKKMNAKNHYQIEYCNIEKLKNGIYLLNCGWGNGSVAEVYFRKYSNKTYGDSYEAVAYYLEYYD